MTANAMAEDRDRCLAAGMDDYLAKPVRREQLAAALDRAVGLADLDRLPGAQLDAAVVDPSVLRALIARLGDRGPELLERLLDTWEAETDQRLDELRAAVEAGDAKAVGRVAHAVRGGSGSLGAVELAAVCGEVEEELRSGRAVDLRAAAARIAAATVGARAGLAQLRVGSGG